MGKAVHILCFNRFQQGVRFEFFSPRVDEQYSIWKQETLIIFFTTLMTITERMSASGDVSVLSFKSVDSVAAAWWFMPHRWKTLKSNINKRICHLTSRLDGSVIFRIFRKVNLRPLKQDCSKSTYSTIAEHSPWVVPYAFPAFVRDLDKPPTKIVVFSGYSCNSIQSTCTSHTSATIL